MKKKWIKYALIYLVFVLMIIGIKKMLSYESLFSKEFCDGIEKIYFHGFDENVYEIEDEAVIAELRQTLYENKYKKIKESRYREGNYSFVIVSDGKEYDLGLDPDYICWEGQHKVKEPLDELIDELLVQAGVK